MDAHLRELRALARPRGRSPAKTLTGDVRRVVLRSASGLDQRRLRALGAEAAAARGIFNDAVNECLAVGAFPERAAVSCVYGAWDPVLWQDAMEELVCAARANGVETEIGDPRRGDTGPDLGVHLTVEIVGVAPVAPLVSPDRVRSGDVLVALGSLRAHGDVGAAPVSISWLGMLVKPLTEGRIASLVRVDDLGLEGALERALPRGLAAAIESPARPAEAAGMVACVREADAPAFLDWIAAWNEPAWRLGRVEAASAKP